MRVGVLELLSDSAVEGWGRRFYGRRFRRHYASIMPQVISVWARQLGHDVTYATWYGQQDPRSLLPAELDVVFLSTYTHASATAYALARLFRRQGTLTVLGGPHARSFPTDSLRFFDLVVKHCDRALVDDIVKRRFHPGTLVSSAAPPTELPSVEERMPELIKSSLTTGRRPMAANVSLLSSIGCPYTCDFCIDWDSPYASVPSERLAEDLRFVSEKLPGVYVSFHDPNFGVNFDQTLSVLESIPEGKRNPYFMESSLSILKGPRLKRLQATNCRYVAPGIESWADYSNKAASGSRVGWDKVSRVVEHFEELNEYVPNLQANFIFGTDVDEGDDPVLMTEEFMRRVPQVWPVMNIPTPFGGTPLYDAILAEGRLLTAMPFSFYYMPHLVTTLKNYTPLEYYDRMIRLHESAHAWSTLRERVSKAGSLQMGVINVLRNFGGQGNLRKLRLVREQLRSDPQFLAFHEGRSPRLPEYYRARHVARLGRYAELLEPQDASPVSELVAAPARTAGASQAL